MEGSLAARCKLLLESNTAAMDMQYNSTEVLLNISTIGEQD